MLVTSDAVDPNAVTSIGANSTAGEIAADLQAADPSGGDDASAAVAVITNEPVHKNRMV